MHSFYGNIKSIASKSSFVFDKIYSSRCDLEDNVKIDNIYAGRFVLVEYGERYNTNNGSSKKTLVETNEYHNNRIKDELRYKMSYDSTVWQKIWEGNDEKYIMVAELNATAPKITVIEDAPFSKLSLQTDGDDFDGPLSASPHFDLIHSTDLDYKLHIPQIWKLENDTYFDYNASGFNKNFRNIVTNLKITKIKENDKITHDFTHDVSHSTIATRASNKIEWLEENVDKELYPSHKKNTVYGVEEWVPDYHENGDIDKSLQVDSKKLLIDLPEIGNMMSDIWDLIYPNWYSESDKKKLGKTFPNGDEGQRHLFIGNDRDPNNYDNYPTTLAEVIRYVYDLIGLKSDNDYIQDPPWGTIYGILNGASTIFGDYSDELSSRNFVPIRMDSDTKQVYTSLPVSMSGLLNYNDIQALEIVKDENDNSVISLSPIGQDTTFYNEKYYYTSTGVGTIPQYSVDNKEKYFQQIQNMYGSLYTPVIYTNENGEKYIIFEEATVYNNQTQYYRDLNSLWGYLKDFLNKKKNYQADWTNDVPSSIGYIKNRPRVIFPTKIKIANEDINGEQKIEDTNYRANEDNAENNIPIYNLYSIEERWKNQYISTTQSSSLIDIELESGESAEVQILTAAEISEAYKRV